MHRFVKCDKCHHFFVVLSDADSKSKTARERMGLGGPNNPNGGNGGPGSPNVNGEPGAGDPSAAPVWDPGVFGCLALAAGEGAGG